MMQLNLEKSVNLRKTRPETARSLKSRKDHEGLKIGLERGG